MRRITCNIVFLFFLFIYSTGLLTISENATSAQYLMYGVSADDSFTFIVERYGKGIPHYSVVNALGPLENTLNQMGTEFSITITTPSVEFPEFTDSYVDVEISNNTHNIADIIEIRLGSFIINTDWEHWFLEINNNQTIISTGWAEPRKSLWQTNIESDMSDELFAAIEFEDNFTFSNSSTLTLGSKADLRYSKTTGMLNYLSMNNTYLDNNEIKTFYLNIKNKDYVYTPRLRSRGG